MFVAESLASGTANAAKHTMRVRTSLLVAAIALVSSRANAQGVHEDALPAPAPVGAFETTLATGYARGLGTTGAQSLASLSADSLSARFTAGLRVNAAWSVALAGELQVSDASGTHNARGAGGGALVTWHLAPERRVAPWIEYEAGYRRLWETSPAGVRAEADAFDLARVLVGIDLRASDLVAVGPATGGGVAVYASDGTRLGGFLFVGLQGRFDLFSSVGD
jgi:hypothetical protein